MVHLANFGTESLIVMVTDQGGPGRPHMVDAGADAESGRGLAVIEALTTFLTWFDNDPLRSVLAVVPPEPSGIRATPQASTAAAIRLVTWGGAPASCSLVWHAPACVPLQLRNYLCTFTSWKLCCGRRRTKTRGPCWNGSAAGPAPPAS